MVKFSKIKKNPVNLSTTVATTTTTSEKNNLPESATEKSTIKKLNGTDVNKNIEHHSSNIYDSDRDVIKSNGSSIILPRKYPKKIIILQNPGLVPFLSLF